MTKPRRKAKSKPNTGQLPVLIPAAARGLLKAEDLQALFSPDEVRQLKLTVLTSADPGDRITGIRRLALAPGPVKEKGAVLLTALSDDDPQVRLEAIKALVPLGLNPDVAREARHLVSGTEKQKVAAAGRIGKIAADAGPGEVSVLLTLVAGTLRTQVSADARRELVLSLAAAAPTLAAEPAQLNAAVVTLAEQIAERPVEIQRPAYRVIAALGAVEPDATADALESEARRIQDHEVRRLLLGSFSGFEVPAARVPALIALMTDEILLAPEPETQCLGIANSLCRWSADPVAPLLAALARADRPHRAFLLRIIDNIASGRGVPVDLKADVARRFLALVKTEPATIRAIILECEILSDAALPAPLKTEIATEIIGQVHEFGGPRMIDLIERAIVRLGPPALEPLLALVLEGVRDRERISAARIVGQIIGRLPGRSRKNAETALRILMAFVRRLDQDFPDKNVLATAIGQMCATRAIPSDTVRRVARGLRVRVGKEPYSFGLLDGLGRLASSPNVELAIRVEVAESFLRLLEVDLPEMQSKHTVGGEKTIFIAGNEAAAYTDMIPILLDGLGNVCIHADSPALQRRLVDALLAKWRDTSSWRVIWGPGNTLKLAEVLGSVALAPNATSAIRLEIAQALIKSSDLVPVLRVLSRLFAADDRSAEIGRIAANVAAHLLDRIAPRSGDRIDLDAAVTNALAVIAARKTLGPPDHADRLRTAILSVLYKALRSSAPDAKLALMMLARSAALPAKTRNEIESRLDAATT